MIAVARVAVARVAVTRVAVTRITVARVTVAGVAVAGVLAGRYGRLEIRVDEERVGDGQAPRQEIGLVPFDGREVGQPQAVRPSLVTRPTDPRL